MLEKHVHKYPMSLYRWNTEREYGLHKLKISV